MVLVLTGEKKGNTHPRGTYFILYLDEKTFAQVEAYRQKEGFKKRKDAVMNLLLLGLEYASRGGGRRPVEHYNRDLDRLSGHQMRYLKPVVLTPKKLLEMYGLGDVFDEANR